jgi:hypothetical protein
MAVTKRGSFLAAAADAATIHYNRRKVYIREVLTHADYGRGNWKRRK